MSHGRGNIDRTILDKFFRIKFREKYYESIITCKPIWTIHSRMTTLKDHRGYRSQGRNPLLSIQAYLDIVRHEA